MNKIIELEKDLMRKDIPKFNVGDTLKVFVKIQEGDKTRLQGFEGICIARKGSGMKESFTVRRISYGEGIERVFQLHSPSIDSVEVVKRGKAKRAKLYYLKKKVGRETKIEEEQVSDKKQDASVGEDGVS
jgi:large subunit ribosomal protein L19